MNVGKCGPSKRHMVLSSNLAIDDSLNLLGSQHTKFWVSMENPKGLALGRFLNSQLLFF